MQEYFKEVQKKYTDLLSKMDYTLLSKYIRYNSYRRAVNNGENPEPVEYDEKAYEYVKEVLDRYKAELKETLKANGNELVHISSVGMDELEDHSIKVSKNILNNNEVERGDWVFASSTEKENNLYAARIDGYDMFRIGDNAMIYNGDNIDVVPSEDGSKRAVLKKPNYVYHLNGDDFEPVVDISWDRNNGNAIVFDLPGEWVSTKNIDITTPNQVRRVEKITDVTYLLENNM